MTVDRRTSEAMVDRWLAGESIASLVDDYGAERMPECVIREELRDRLEELLGQVSDQFSGCQHEIRTCKCHQVCEWRRDTLVTKLERLRSENLDIVITDALQAEIERLRGLESDLIAWKDTFGAALCPTGADTFGERAAKAQIADMVSRAVEDREHRLASLAAARSRDHATLERLRRFEKPFLAFWKDNLMNSMFRYRESEAMEKAAHESMESRAARAKTEADRGE